VTARWQDPCRDRASPAVTSGRATPDLRGHGGDSHLDLRAVLILIAARQQFAVLFGERFTRAMA
jgi:hypothetical protein